MKKLIFAFVFSICSLWADAKTYTASDVIKDGTVWRFKLGYPTMDPNVTYPTEAFVTAKGTALYDGKEYVKIYYSTNLKPDIDENKIPCCALRVEGEKVYAYTFGKEPESEILAYDFSLQVGDEIELTCIPQDFYYIDGVSRYNKGKVKCDSREKYITCGNIIEIMTLTSYYEDPNDEVYNETLEGERWISGMGAYGPIYDNIVFVSISGGPGYFLQDITVDGVKVLDKNDLKPYIDSVEDIEIEKNNSDIKKFRPNGMPFNSGEKGIYIENGKKHVAY